MSDSSCGSARSRQIQRSLSAFMVCFLPIGIITRVLDHITRPSLHQPEAEAGDMVLSYRDLKLTTQEVIQQLHTDRIEALGRTVSSRLASQFPAPSHPEPPNARHGLGSALVSQVKRHFWLTSASLTGAGYITSLGQEYVGEQPKVVKMGPHLVENDVTFTFCVWYRFS